MRKLIIPAVVLVILAALFIFVLKQANSTTYGEVISNLLVGEGEVDEIEIIWMIRESQGDRRQTAVVVEKDAIAKIVEGPSEMQLKAQSKTPKVGEEFFWVTLKTDTGSIFEIVFGSEGDIQIGDGFYKVVDENQLRKIIVNEQFDWE